MKISTVQQMRKMDMEAMTSYGIPGEILMENAGHAVYYAILREVGVRHRDILVLAGPGNNGGDGFVVARKLHSSGARIRVLVLADPDSYSGPAAKNLARLQKAGIHPRFQPGSEEMGRAMEHCDAVVDGLLGTGITREVTGIYREAVEALNRGDRPVFSIDIPSGVDGDTGQIRGRAVKATYTVTFGLPKLGNLLHPGGGLSGHLMVSHISFPPKLLEEAEIRVRLNEPEPLDSPGQESGDTKGDPVLFLLGEEVHPGGQALGARAFLEVGGERAPVVAPRSRLESLECVAEAVAVEGQEAESRLSTRLQDLLRMGRSCRMMVAGRGFTTSPSVLRLVRELVRVAENPILLGGDAIPLFKGHPDLLQQRPGPTALVLTLEEATTFTGHSAEELRSRGPGLLADWAEELGVMVVLLGPPSLVSCPGRRTFLSPSPAPLAEISGAGDILGGIAAASCQEGQSLEEALRTGLFVVGSAAEEALGAEGAEDVPPRSLLHHLSGPPRALREAFESMAMDYFGALEVV